MRRVEGGWIVDDFNNSVSQSHFVCPPTNRMYVPPMVMEDKVVDMEDMVDILVMVDMGFTLDMVVMAINMIMLEKINYKNDFMQYGFYFEGGNVF